MQMQITFRDMDPSEAIDQYVRDRASKLDRFATQILRCHVTIEMPHRHQRHGRPYRVRIDLAVAGADIVVGNPSAENDTTLDVYAAIDNAFDHAKRRLEEWERRHREERRRA